MGVVDTSKWASTSTSPNSMMMLQNGLGGGAGGPMGVQGGYPSVINQANLNKMSLIANGVQQHQQDWQLNSNIFNNRVFTFKRTHTHIYSQPQKNYCCFEWYIGSFISFAFFLLMFFNVVLFNFFMFFFYFVVWCNFFLFYVFFFDVVVDADVACSSF